MGPPIAIASLALGAIGSVASFAGAESSANAQSQAAAYQAQVASNNAIIANQNAEYATQAGQAQATTKSLENRARLGAAVAGEAANGIDVTSGSAVDVQATNREMGAVDVANTVNNAALQAYGYRTNATSFTAQSQLDTAEASQAKTAGAYSALGSLASGASGLAQKWNTFQTQGVVDTGSL